MNKILEDMQKPHNLDDDEDLYVTALRFRLLRQQGYYISCDIFNKFTNEKGDFKESIVKDESGILSLYEASYLRMNGENILEKALTFTTTRLEAMAMSSTSQFGEEAKYALKWPICKAMPRFMTRNNISLYQNNPFKNNTLITFAKLDYNALQKLYQKELVEFSRWLKDLKLVEQLCFARDRVVECFIWALGVHYAPNYSNLRRYVAKIIGLISIVDDMYDAYATLDELWLFTNAIQRWDVNCIEKLPNYMKGLYKAILEFYGEIEQEICKDKDVPFAFEYAKEAMKRQCRTYVMETKWFHERHIPRMEEYMEVATPSAGYHLFTSIAFLASGNVASKQASQWAQPQPTLLIASGVIGRLMNDIASHKFEQERGHVASAIECYMKEHKASEEEAVAEQEKQVVKAWKDIIEDYTESAKLIPNVILDCVLNFARLSDLFYKETDGYTFADGATKQFIIMMLTDPVPI